jgi:hypothetical protein
MLNETVDAFYNRFKELFDEIQDADGNIPIKNAMCHFILMLGTEFESIQNNYRIENLPPKWQTEDWPKLLVLCQNYFNSVKPQGVQTTKKENNFSQHSVDHLTHQKKVKEWFLNPAKYCKEIALEQRKFPNKCIYHLSETHITEDCHLKKECDKIVSEKKLNKSPVSPTGSTTGQLRHITEEQFVDAELDDTPAAFDDNGNDTNKESLLYFA